PREDVASTSPTAALEGKSPAVVGAEPLADHAKNLEEVRAEKKVPEPAPEPLDAEGTQRKPSEKRDGSGTPTSIVAAEPAISPLAEGAVAGPPSVAHVRDIDGLRRGLEKSRGKEGLFGRLLTLFAGKKEIDASITAELEEVLLSSDVGTRTTETLLARVRERLSRGELRDTDAVWQALREEVNQILVSAGPSGAFSLRDKPTVVLLVGVNGVGKTTTIGKLATKLKSEGRTVVLAAGDTFRAAAVQQLVVWGSRAGVEVVRGRDGADPGSVIFDAVQRAKQLGADVVLADTAGRLHTKSNLMAELKKVVKTTSKASEGAPHEVLLVVDATNGQNALAQAAEFQQAMPLTGVVLTKLDGTAKGGVVIGICDALRLPVRFVGLGETANDLHDFVPEEFVEALLGREL
ncbi:MAG TPA: signal recognition particle-docking protein FtsY, partial [Polyangiaceae bacterium]